MIDPARELLRQALELLPKMPSTIEVFSDDGGCFELTLASHERDLIYAYGDRERVRDDLVLEARIRNDEGDGCNIRFTILRTYFQSGKDLLVHLHVTEIEEHYATRAAPRARLADVATAQVVYSRLAEVGEAIDIRVADVSTTGVAFITDRCFAAGDLLELGCPVNGRLVQIEVRVVRTIPALYGRNRVGCEIIRVLEADRHSIALLALVAAQGGREDDRRPEVLETLRLARDRQTFGDLRTRRYPDA